MAMRATLISYGLLVTLTSASAQGWPLLDYLARWPRQVVQPTWLTDGAAEKESKPVAPVKIDAKNLQEAAEIRASIQKAVDANQFAVESGSNNKFKIPTASKSTNAQRAPAWPNNMWQWQWQWQWPQWSFQWPSLAAQQENWQRMFQGNWQRRFRMPATSAAQH